MNEATFDLAMKYARACGKLQGAIGSILDSEKRGGVDKKHIIETLKKALEEVEEDIKPRLTVEDKS